MNKNQNQTQEAGTDYLFKLAEAQRNINEAEALDGGTGKFADLIAEAKAERAAIRAEREENRRQEKRLERERAAYADEDVYSRIARKEAKVLTLSELRDLLFELVQAESQNGNEWVSKDMVHIVKEVKYGEIVSTAGITGAKMVTENGARHIILTTTN